MLPTKIFAENTAKNVRSASINDLKKIFSDCPETWAVEKIKIIENVFCCIHQSSSIKCLFWDGNVKAGQQRLLKYQYMKAVLDFQPEGSFQILIKKRITGKILLILARNLLNFLNYWFKYGFGWIGDKSHLLQSLVIFYLQSHKYLPTVKSLFEKSNLKIESYDSYGINLANSKTITYRGKF